VQVSRYWKAIVAAAATGLGTLATAMNGDAVVTPAEWVSVLLAVAGAFGVTYVVPNRPPYPPRLEAVEDAARTGD
jgi:uncharacterized membrane protein